MAIQEAVSTETLAAAGGQGVAGMLNALIDAVENNVNPGHTHSLSSGATDVTATYTELNTLDGITSTTAELNILDGVTSTASELNILDGVTANKDEINLLDGLTAISGSDTTIITGTEGTENYTAKWNGDGDLVDGYEVKDEDDMSSDSNTALSTQQAIKAYVDTNASSNGWISSSEAWTRKDSDEIYAAGDVTETYQKGDKVKFTQATDGIKYMYIISVSAYDSGNDRTTLKVTGGDDYDLDDESISSPCYSKLESPQDFPQWFSYTPTSYGFSSVPTVVAEFNIRGNICFYHGYSTAWGTSNTTAYQITVPMTPLSSTILRYFPIKYRDNSTNSSTSGVALVNANNAALFFYTDWNSGAWTSSNQKNADFNVWYDI